MEKETDENVTPPPKLCLVNHITGPAASYAHNYAVLEMTLDYALHLLKLMGVAGVFDVEGECFYRVFYFHTGPEYYGTWDENVDDKGMSDDLLAELDEAIDQGDWVVMPEAYVPPTYPGRTEAETIGVDRSSVVFKANPKHCDAELEGSILTRTLLADVANRLMKIHAKEEANKVSRTSRQRVIQLDESEKSRA